MTSSTDQSNTVAKLPTLRFERVCQDLRARIARGEWPVDSQLPGRQALATEYGVNLSTVQRAIVELLGEGTLRAVNRQGTFVARIPAIPVISESSSVAESNARHGHPGIIGIIGEIKDLMYAEEYNFNPRIIEGMEQTISLAGGITSTFNILNQIGEQISWEETAKRVCEQAVDGIVFTDPYSSRFPGIFTAMQLASASGIPVVHIADDEIISPFPTVFYDQRYAGYQAADHLLKAGYTRLIFLHPYGAGSWYDRRVEGARTAVRQAGLPDDHLCLYPEIPPYDKLSVNHTMIISEAVMADALQAGMLDGDDAYAIITPNDADALGVMKALCQQGILPGKEVGVIGFDDDPLSRWFGLSTMRPPLHDLGAQAADVLLHAMNGEQTAAQTRLRSQLIVRASTSRQLSMDIDDLSFRLRTLENQIKHNAH